MIIRSSIFILIILLLSAVGYAQTNEEMAESKVIAAVKMMDSGMIEESIAMLEEAQKLNPADIDIPYEIAYANYLKNDYPAAIKILSGLKKHKDVNPLIYQMLGNSYSKSGDRKKAIKAYESGIKKFPYSGRLYLERGTMEAFIGNYDQAVKYYEQGIKIDPRFPSNYFRAAQLYCGSSERVWGMIYGELFMNLESGSDRTVAMSQILYNGYHEGIQFTEENEVTVSFSKNNMVTFTSIRKPESLKIPYGILIYESTIGLALIGEQEINISSLNRIRTRFLELYYEKGYDLSFPNALFDYQKKVMEAGHLESYNYWILSQGDPEGFEEWRGENIGKWNAFINWFTENKIELNSDNLFYREQY